MNKDRRTAIDTVRKEIETAQAALETAREQLETIRDEEQKYYDNMPESLQSGDKGDAANNAVCALDTAVR